MERSEQKEGREGRKSATKRKGREKESTHRQTDKLIAIRVSEGDRGRQRETEGEGKKEGLFFKQHQCTVHKGQAFSCFSGRSLTRQRGRGGESSLFEKSAQ